MKKKHKIILVNGKKPRCVTTKTSNKWPVQKIEGLLKEIIEWMGEKENIFVTEYLVKNNIYPQLITDKIRSFQKQDPAPDLTEVYRLYSIAKKIQELKLVKGGLLKEYDPTITQLVLSHNHQYKRDIQQAANIGFTFQQNILNANVQDQSAAEHARHYLQAVRNLPGGQPIPLSGADEIQADTE